DITQTLLRQWAGTGLCESRGSIDFGLNRRFHLENLIRTQNPPVDAESLIPHQRVAQLPFGNLFLRTVMTGITAGMAAEAVSLEFQQRRPFATGGPLPCFAHCMIDRFHIVSIDRAARNSVGGGPLADAWYARDLFYCGGCAIPVVLANEY